MRALTLFCFTFIIVFNTCSIGEVAEVKKSDSAEVNISHWHPMFQDYYNFMKKERNYSRQSLQEVSSSLLNKNHLFDFLSYFDVSQDPFMTFEVEQGKESATDFMDQSRSAFQKEIDNFSHMNGLERKQVTHRFDVVVFSRDLWKEKQYRKFNFSFFLDKADGLKGRYDFQTNDFLFSYILRNYDDKTTQISWQHCLLYKTKLNEKVMLAGNSDHTRGRPLWKKSNCMVQIQYPTYVDGETEAIIAKRQNKGRPPLVFVFTKVTDLTLEKDYNYLETIN